MKILEHNPLTIVDVGASGGLQSRWRMLEPWINPILFEPDPSSFNHLVNTSHESYTILNTALSDKKGRISLHICNKAEVSSIYEPNFEFLNLFHNPERFYVEKKIMVETDTLENQLVENEINEIDFIKIDAQGHELNILKGAGTYLDGTIGIETEVEFSPMYVGQPLFNDVNQFLTAKSFDLIDIKRYYWKRQSTANIFQNKGQLVFGDALYLKSPEDICKYQKSDLKKIIKAIIIYLIYGYYDLANELVNLSKGIIDVKTEKYFLQIIKNKPYIFFLKKIKSILTEVKGITQRNSYYQADRTLGSS